MKTVSELYVSGNNQLVDTKLKLVTIKSLPKITWILILALILRLSFIFRLPVGDENLTLKGVRISFGEIVPYLSDPLNRDPYPPLFYWTMHIWDSIVPSPTWDRLLLVLFGLGTVFITYRIGEYLGEKRLGLVSASLMACFPLSIWADQWLRPYSVAAFFSALTALTYLYAVKEGHVRTWLSFVLAALALIYTFYLGAIILVVLGLHFLFFAKKSRLLLLRWIISQLSVIVVFALWVPKMLLQLGGSTGVAEIIHKKGFWIGNLHIGALINSWLGTFGLDSLWSPAPIAELPTWYLLTTITIFGALAILTLLGWWKALHCDKRLAYWVAWFSIMPAVVGFILHQITQLPLVHHYFSMACWSGAIAIGLSILNLSKRYRLCLIGLLAGIITWRFVDLYTFLVMQWGQ